MCICTAVIVCHVPRSHLPYPHTSLIFLLLCTFLHLNDMMNDPSSARLHLLFDASLQSYEKQTRLKLVDHPLVLELENCHTVDSIMEVLQNKACTFTRFREDGGKIMRSVKRVVHVLHALSTNSVLGEGCALVCRTAFCVPSF